MKTKMFGSLPSLLKTSLPPPALWAVLLLCPGLAAAVSFTVTPSTISNTYSGNIILIITGLNTSETVVVQKFLDINTNGAIDASDWLVGQWRLTDGQANVIGGVTNVNDFRPPPMRSPSRTSRSGNHSPARSRAAAPMCPMPACCCLSPRRMEEVWDRPLEV